MLSNIKGVIFDLDGTIVDSMWVWSQIDIDYLKKKGHAVPNDLKNDIEHLSFIRQQYILKIDLKLKIQWMKYLVIGIMQHFIITLIM